MMSDSLAVCQCHGTEQPGLNFSIIVDGPLLGSPCITESVMHVGRPAMFPNLLVAGDITPIALISCAANADVIPTSSNNTPRMRLFKSHPQEWDCRIGESIPEKGWGVKEISNEFLVVFHEFRVLLVGQRIVQG